VGSRITLVLALAAITVIAPASSLAVRSSARSNTTTYTDSTGENPNAPDITTVVVSNDDAGLITFKVNISNRPTMTGDMSVVVFLNTDKLVTTGDSTAAGADYLLELDPGVLTLYKWNGSTYVTAPSQSLITFGYDSTGATMRVPTIDIDRTKAFDFWAFALSGIAFDANGNADLSNSKGDLAPDADHGTFAYDVLTKLTLSVAGFTTSPTPAKAGKSFVASLAANESDTAGPVKTGTVACVATIGGKHLAATAHRVANGVATCSWTLPRKTKGTVKGSVSLKVQGVSVVRTFAVKVT
jgi:hypothetical protein